MPPEEAWLQDVSSCSTRSRPAAEKTMKAFLAWHDHPFRKTHSLEELGRQCVALDTTLAVIADEAAPLTEYAWKYRYPGEAAEPQQPEAEQALATARNVYAAILKRLPPKVRP
jgi:HEPN domain-containing protein